MKYISITIIILLYSLIYSFTADMAEAQVTKPQGGFSTTVSAAVGEFYLNVSGYISPYASVVLTSGGKFYRSAVADSSGNFYISSVLINRGFSNFCLTAIDFKRLGESITCFYFPPAKNSITMTDLFLPPTMGISRTEVAAGSTVMAFGYTMPNATVTININNIKYTVTANGQGYYQFPIKDLKAGTYQLFAGAKHNGKDSLRPSKYLKLKALSLWEQFLAFIRDIWERVRRVVTSVGLGPLWFGIPILILIIILILKLWPERFTFVYESRLVKFFSGFHPGKKKMHHEWFIGY